MITILSMACTALLIGVLLFGAAVAGITFLLHYYVDKEDK